MIKFFENIKAAYHLAKSPNFGFIERYSPGHYHSPVPGVDDVNGVDWDALGRSRNIPGVDLREQEQLELLDRMAAFYPELPFPKEQDEVHRFYLHNSWFSYADAIVLYGMLRHFRPARVIEVGSGYSSALMLDTRDALLDKATEFTFIEPYPTRLNKLLRPADKVNSTIIDKPIQEVDLKTFEALVENDILFIDTSHVVKVQSDVVHIVSNILPVLNEGVIVHFHDIYWPFDYPKDWLLAGRAWNEAYYLRAFMQYNNAFQVIYYNAFMNIHRRTEIEKKMPLCLVEGQYRLTHGASSLWLKKIAK